MIEIFGLVKDFGKVRAVNHLTLRIPQGEFFGFLGPNGAGKTTTIKILAGLLRPTAGMALVGGFDIASDIVRAKQISSYIPDKPFIYEKLTGREFLRFITDLYRISKKDAIRREGELIELFSMGEWADELIEGYSHGMRQKMVMSAALITDPKTIIVDEPMVGLDPKSIKLVKDIYTNLARRGVTIFMSTHTLVHAEEMCDRIGIINRGRLIAVGSIDELMEQARAKERELEEIFFTLTEEEVAEARQ